MTIRRQEQIGISKKKFKTSYIFVLYFYEYAIRNPGGFGTASAETFTNAKLYFHRPCLEPIVFQRGYGRNSRVLKTFCETNREVSAQQQRANPRLMQHVWQTVADNKDNISGIDI